MHNWVLWQANEMKVYGFDHYKPKHEGVCNVITAVPLPFQVKLCVFCCTIWKPQILIVIPTTVRTSRSMAYKAGEWMVNIRDQ